MHFNLLSANPTKWSNALKQFVSKFPTNCLSVFDHFLGLALKGLKRFSIFDFITLYDLLQFLLPFMNSKLIVLRYFLLILDLFKEHSSILSKFQTSLVPSYIMLVEKELFISSFFFS